MKTPYDNYKSLEIWTVIEKSINELEENKDLELKTHIDYIIGYIADKIINSN